MGSVILGDREQTQCIAFPIKSQTCWGPRGASIYPWCKVRVVYGVVLNINIVHFNAMDLICRWAVQFNICLNRLKMQMTQRMTIRATQGAAVGCYMVLL